MARKVGSHNFPHLFLIFSVKPNKGVTMATVEKKIWPKYFELIKQGKKTFEIRLADFEIKEGDILLLREWDPEKKEYTGRVLKLEVTYVTNTKNQEHWSKEEIEKYGLLVISFKPCR